MEFKFLSHKNSPEAMNSKREKDKGMKRGEERKRGVDEEELLEF